MAVEAAAQFAEDTMLGGPPFDFQDARFKSYRSACFRNSRWNKIG
jgi:hypothetical protein